MSSVCSESATQRSTSASSSSSRSSKSRFWPTKRWPRATAFRRAAVRGSEQAGAEGVSLRAPRPPLRCANQPGPRPAGRACPSRLPPLLHSGSAQQRTPSPRPSGGLANRPPRSRGPRSCKGKAICSVCESAQWVFVRGVPTPSGRWASAPSSSRTRSTLGRGPADEPPVSPSAAREAFFESLLLLWIGLSIGGAGYLLGVPESPQVLPAPLRPESAATGPLLDPLGYLPRVPHSPPSRGGLSSASESWRCSEAQSSGEASGISCRRSPSP
jgi:hypothetical protein